MDELKPRPLIVSSSLSETNKVITTMVIRQLDDPTCFARLSVVHSRLFGRFRQAVQQFLSSIIITQHSASFYALY